MVFSTNQVRHILAENTAKNVKVTKTLLPDQTVYFTQHQPSGDQIGTIISRSDIIPVENIVSISSASPTSPFKQITIGGDIAATDYLKVRIFDSPGSTNPIINYIKPTKVSKLGLVWNDDAKTLTQEEPGSTAGAKDGIIYFDVEVVDKDLAPKADMTYTEGHSTNYKAYGLLLLEKFCNSFKSSMEFGVGYPYASQELPTYIDPTNANFVVTNIHYYYSGSNEATQKSEKDLTIVTVAPMTAVINELKTLNPSIKLIEDTITVEER